MPAGGSSRWGWHRLSDRWARQLVADAGVAPGELVLDIGAGTGALTAWLVAAGARVVAIEIHPGRLATLRRRFACEPVTVVRADASDLRLPRRPFRVVANPPYAISSALLRRLLARGSRLTAADLVLQSALARRWSEGGAPGAGRWLREFDLRVGRRIPRAAFDPPPSVDSNVLVVRRRGHPSPPGRGARVCRDGRRGD